MRAPVFMVVSCLGALLAGPALGGRFTRVLDGGTHSVTVDNVSKWNNTQVGARVLAADRSTQEDCNYQLPDIKGLMASGDRVLVTDNYLAWFDMSVNDGINFGASGMQGTGSHAGALSGWWTLDPSSTDAAFKWSLVGPIHPNCSQPPQDWAPNELIRGSASPSQQKHFWDKFGPSLEHSIRSVSGDDVYSHSFAMRSTNGQYNLVTDGQVDGNGAVHYKVTGRLTSLNNPQIDVFDHNDANGIQNFVQSEVEYVGRQTNLEVIWRFRPNSQNLVTDNVFTYAWLNYAQDMDGGPCDKGGGGDQWPSSVWRNYKYAQSNVQLKRVKPSATYSPPSVATLIWGTTCGSDNRDINTNQSGDAGNGTYISVGTNSSMSSSSPRLRWTNKTTPGTGSGTSGNPYKFGWRRLLLWNETNDGSVGFGASSGPFSDPADYITLLSGKWYEVRYQLAAAW